MDKIADVSFTHRQETQSRTPSSSVFTAVSHPPLPPPSPVESVDKSVDESGKE
jgi:hypothetical protein